MKPNDSIIKEAEDMGDKLLGHTGVSLAYWITVTVIHTLCTCTSYLIDAIEDHAEKTR